MDHDFVDLHGVRIDNVTMCEAVDRALLGDRPTFVVTPNAVMLDACRKNAHYAALLGRSTLSLADGAGVMLCAKRAGTPLRERIAGIAFGEALLARAAADGLRVFLLGGGEGVAESAARRLCERYAGLDICGSFWGYFQKSGEENRRVVDIIRAARPDILLVCFGFPLQEEWIDAHLSLFEDVRVIAGLGGALDVWAGHVCRAPRFISRCGMEWAWRMICQPKRLRHLPAILRCALWR